LEGTAVPEGPDRTTRPEEASEAAPRVSLRWLGGREVLRDGLPVHLESAKTEALLAWLVLNPGTHARGKLTALLWPELPEERASAGLRRALWDLRRKLAPGDERFVLNVSRGVVETDPAVPLELDVRRLVSVARTRGTAVAQGDETTLLEQAVSLYRGDLLEGLAVSDAPSFEEWLLGERESLRLLVLSTLQRLVVLSRQRGETARALAHARSLLALDPWLEEGHRHVAELLAESGRRGAAIRQLEACRRVLQDELGTVPARETTALERRLRGDRSEASDLAPRAGVAVGPRNNLPLAAAPFVGRARELDLIHRHLADADCRLLTLLGPGGVGKTRLAVQAASRQASRSEAFPDGVVFVPPPEVRGASGLGVALARALELEGGDRDDPAARVVAALREARLLLVLDGFEKRLEESSFLSRLLAEAPDVKAVACSRERLGLGEEWALEIGGLETPLRAETADPGRWDSVRLFLSAARRARVGFDPGPEELASIAEICRAVGGLPLAIEIAAGWVHALPPGEVAAQLARGPGLLAAPSRVQAGGAGLRRVFDEAASCLGPEERRVLNALSVLAGGMTWEAAAAVGPASAETLRALADRSFLRLEASTGRYALHEVLRAFAADDLAARPEEEAAAWERHAEFYGAFLARLATALRDRIDREARDTLAAELENIGSAWSRAVAAGDRAFVESALAPLCSAHVTWGSWVEGERLADGAVRVGLGAVALSWRAAFRLRLGNFEAAETDLAEALSSLGPDGGAARAEALLHSGHAALLRGRFDKAHAALEECVALSRRAGSRRVLAEALGRLGRAVLDEGRHEEARLLFEESLQAALALGSKAGIVFAKNQLGLADYFAGDLDGAGRRLGEALALARAEGSRPAVAAALSGLGFVAEDRGELDVASGYYRESLTACRENGDRYTSARALMLLGEVERKRGDHAAARAFYEEALDLARAVGSVYVTGLLEGNLAYLAAACGRPRKAVTHARAALAACRETGSWTVGLPVLVAMAEVAAGEGEPERALELLGHVLGHPGNRQDHRMEVERVLARIRRDYPAVDVERGLAAGQAALFDDLVSEALDESRPAPRAGGRWR
jgi:DNA-binding SARP family transcriptional activator/predicted ATPase